MCLRLALKTISLLILHVTFGQDLFAHDCKLLGRRTRNDDGCISSIRRVELKISRDDALPTIPIVEKALLVVEQLFFRLDCELHIWAMHDGVDRARFLAKPAIDAFRHVDIVPRGPATTVRSRLDFDDDAVGWTYRLA